MHYGRSLLFHTITELRANNCVIHPESQLASCEIHLVKGQLEERDDECY